MIQLKYLNDYRKAVRDFDQARQIYSRMNMQATAKEWETARALIDITKRELDRLHAAFVAEHGVPPNRA